MPRKSTPRVKDGRVQKKNNHVETIDRVQLAGTAVAFERRRPGPGYRHLIRRQDLERFVALLPDWDEIATGLELIVLDAGEYELDGWHAPGMIGLCAWERDLWVDYTHEFVDEHQAILSRLGVEIRRDDRASIVCWTEPTARAFQLVHVFLHELGHHHDRITTRSQVRSARGEPYAEAYADRYAEQIWIDYQAEFGL